MKRSLLLLAFTVITVIGCSKKNEFRTAINHSIENEYNCLDLKSSVFVPFMDNKELEQYKKVNDYVIIDEDDSSKPNRNTSHDSEDSDLIRAEALVKVGLLTKTVKREQAMNAADHKPVQSTVFAIHLYNLTAAGKNTIREKHFDGFLGSGDRKYTFCYAHPQVDSIINFSEFDYLGQKAAQVKYSYKLADIANWAQNSEVKAAFPELVGKQLGDTTTNISEILLIKTNNGWQSHL